MSATSNALDGFSMPVKMRSTPQGHFATHEVKSRCCSKCKPVRRRPKAVTRHTWSIRTFDDLVVGDEWERPRRTVTETDVVLFAGLSGDFNPLHVDHVAARENPFGRPVPPGLLRPPI